ncbi:MAG: hypothetical protein AB1757_17220 [Acidobacteriota bacterium]
MILKSLQLLLLFMVSAITVSAQLDRARADPYADFKRYYDDTVKYAEQKDRDSALKASNDLRERALAAISGLSQDAPSRLNDGNLRDLANQAQAFIEAIRDFSGRLQNLQDKLKRTGEDYSSEVSSLKSSYDNFNEKFNIIWTNLQLAGRALKAACMQGCIP